MTTEVNINTSNPGIELPVVRSERNRREEEISGFAEGRIQQEAPAQTAGVAIAVRNRAGESQTARSIAFLLQDMDELDRSFVVPRFEKRSPDDLEDFVRQLQSLITPDMNGSQICAVISALERIKAGPENFVRQALSLTTQNSITQKMSGEKKSIVITYLSKIKAEDRRDFVGQVWRLITPEMDGTQKFLTISLLAEIPTVHRARIMREIVSIPIGERLRYLEQAYLRFRE